MSVSARKVLMSTTPTLLAAFALLLGPPRAEAAILPPYVVDGLAAFALADQQGASDFGPVSLDVAGRGSLSIDSSGTPSPSIRVETVLTGGINAKADEVVSYFFQIVGPPGSVEVPVEVSASGHIEGFAPTGSQASALASWFLAPLSFSTILASDDLRKSLLGPGSFVDAFSSTHDVTLMTNKIYQVGMEARSFGQLGFDGSTVGASAFIDPVFSFGPGVDTSVYSFEFSSGIGNTPITSAVPEPASLAAWALVVVGCCLGNYRRRPIPA